MELQSDLNARSLRSLKVQKCTFPSVTDTVTDPDTDVDFCFLRVIHPESPQRCCKKTTDLTVSVTVTVSVTNFDGHEF